MKRKMRVNPTSTGMKSMSGTTRVNLSQQPPVEKKNSSKFIILTIVLLLAFIVGGAIFLYFLSEDLPSLSTLERIDPEMATQVYSIDGEVLHSFFRFNRTFTPYEKIPRPVIDALISVEDRSFYNHWGINLRGIARAIIIDIIHLDPTKQGASTITMQLARNLYFGFKRTWTRKIKEALTAIQIERTYAKNEIIEMYLNFNFFGNNAYGIRSAARRYFDKNVDELTTPPCAILNGLSNAGMWY
jgi:penicillin-binding protein 1A